MNISENITDLINDSRIDLENGRLIRLANAERSVQINMSITGALSRSFGLVLACTGILCNFYAIKAVTTVKSDKLKAKWLIFNLLCADFLLPLFSSLDLLLYIIYGYGVTSHYIYNCVRVLYNTSNPMGLYYQCLSSLVLAGDRLYAILAPLQYYSVGYPRWMLLCIIGSTWIIPLLLTMPVFIIPFIKQLRVAGPGVCYKLRAGYEAWTESVRSPIVISLGMTTFCIYIILFILVKRIRKTNLALTETRSTNRKTSVSLTVTYFVVHCVSLVLLLPAPIYAMLISLRLEGVLLNIATRKTIRRILVLFYMVNPIADSIILSIRIPVVRETLKRILGFKQDSPHRPNTGESTEKPTRLESVTIT